MRRLREGVEVVVATPGRLLDLIGRSALSLDRLAYLVLDEADRMLDLNMEQQLRMIIGLAQPVGRQTLLWSATLPHALDRLARSAVLRPITVRVGMGQQRGGTTAGGVKQRVLFVHTYQKPMRLLELLRATTHPPVIVFCNSHRTVDRVARVLRQEQFHVAALHGELPQAQRFKAMEYFKQGGCDVLVATDLAQRGIDVSSVTHVIQYDLPDSIEAYVHRCGRTGRAGQHGQASSLLTLDCSIATELRRVLRENHQPVPVELENTKKFGVGIIRTEFGDVAKRRSV